MNDGETRDSRSNLFRRCSASYVRRKQLKLLAYGVSVANTTTTWSSWSKGKLVRIPACVMTGYFESLKAVTGVGNQTVSSKVFTEPCD